LQNSPRAFKCWRGSSNDPLGELKIRISSNIKNADLLLLGRKRLALSNLDEFYVFYDLGVFYLAKMAQFFICEIPS
jgi:hypothetical protein